MRRWTISRLSQISIQTNSYDDGQIEHFRPIDISKFEFNLLAMISHKPGEEEIWYASSSKKLEEMASTLYDISHSSWYQEGFLY